MTDGSDTKYPNSHKRGVNMNKIKIPDEIVKDLEKIRSPGETMVDVIKRLIEVYYIVPERLGLD
mgnify:FL=1